MLLLSRWPFLRAGSSSTPKKKSSFSPVSVGDAAYADPGSDQVYLLPFYCLVFQVLSPQLVINAKWLQKQLGELQGAEILAAAVVVLQVLQFILHHLRYRRSHWLLQWGAWGAYYITMPLAGLAVGEMLRLRQPLWPVAILFAAGQSDTMAAYSLDDDGQNMRRFTKSTLYLAYLIVALLQLQGLGVSLSPTTIPPAEPYSGYSLFAAFLVFLVHLKVSSMAMVPSGDICMLAAEAGSSRCRSARGQGAVVAVGSLESPESAVSGSTTYEDILAMKYSEKLQDLCLSSALSLQLLQQGYHSPQRVAGSSSANLAFKKLLMPLRGDDNRGGYARALKLVEVQLSLMYDHFFSTHGSPSSASYKLYWNHWVYKISFLMHILSLAYSRPNNAQAEGAEHGTIAPNNAQAEGAEHGTIAVGLVYLLVMLQLCQLVHYLTSDQFLVSYMCDRARALQLSSGHSSSSTCKQPLDMVVLNAISEARDTNLCKHTLGQYSLVEDYSACTASPPPPLGQRLMGRLHLIGRRPQRGYPLSKEEVKAWILEKIVTPPDPPPPTGSGSSKSDAPSSISPSQRRKDQFPRELSWTLHQKTEIHTILTWHIATWMCSMSTVHEVLPSSDYMAATKLSSYCAYLVAFHPELLPGGHSYHKVVARRIFDEATREAELHLNGETSPYGRYTRFISAWERDKFDPFGLLEPGARLAQQLKDIDVKHGSRHCWAVIADFWAQMMMHLALSGSAAAHIEHLAKGGEFLTRLWALLSNAGIQNTLIIKWKKIDGNNKLQSKQASTKIKKM